MPFRRYYNNERNESHVRREEIPAPFAWYLSDFAVEASIAGATIGFSVILIIVWLLKASFLVEQSDIQTAVQISAGLGALSLAIPLFLRDFRVQETLWMSFLILSTIFLISTCVGFVTFLLQSNPEEARLTFAGFVAIIVVSNFRTAIALRRLQRLHKNKAKNLQNSTPDYISVHISPTKPVEFLFIVLLSLVCIFTSSGLPASFLLLFSYGIMLLLATLSASIISALTHHDLRTDAEEAKSKLKDAIQKVLEESPHIAFTEQELLDALRDGPYKGYSHLISRSAVQLAVSEMDIEDSENEPKATIWEYDKVIPRWNDIYDKQSFEATPPILVFEPTFGYEKDIAGRVSDLKEKKSKQLLAAISKKSGLSIELLKDGNILDRLLQRFDKTWSFYLGKIYTIVYIEDSLLNLMPSPSSPVIKKIDVIVRDLQELTWFFGDRYSKDVKLKLLIKFTEDALLNIPNVFAQFFEDKIKEKDLLELLSQRDGMDLRDIEEYFEEVLLKEPFESSPLGKIAKEIIDSSVKEKLKKLWEAGSLQGEKQGNGRLSTIIWKPKINNKNRNNKER